VASARLQLSEGAAQALATVAQGRSQRDQASSVTAATHAVSTRLFRRRFGGLGADGLRGRARDRAVTVREPWQMQLRCCCSCQGVQSRELSARAGTVSLNQNCGSP